ncbi:hypothetical protein C4D60_Mb11t19380 [Musa balbisiana]|uniref:Dof zinc finger protein n=1 Tax=Musa balbisiana TaxID=52838 RepID=A0A4S8J5B6_MUSBA|nr:hypothetical protein C4D60_Mb11t19380 [Musa balbisiana]
MPPPLILEKKHEIGLAVEPMELVPSSAFTTTTTTANSSCTAARPHVTERRARPQKEQALSCPRCNSTNTKFCYYNNYSLTQPRYLCKSCRRYWTEGGSLRNVPVGGGSRKNKRSTTAASAMASHSEKLPTDLIAPPISHATTQRFHEGQDVNLAFPDPEPIDFSNPSDAAGALSAMELLRTGMTARELDLYLSGVIHTRRMVGGGGRLIGSGMVVLQHSMLCRRSDASLLLSRSVYDDEDHNT